MSTASIDNAAVPFNDTFIVKWDGTQVYNACNNELTTVYGSEVVLVHGVYNGNNSTFTANVHFQNGFRTVGESGRQYVIEEAGVYQEKNFSDGVFTAKRKASLRWLTKGGGNNLIWPQTYYYKVDADGNVTFIKDPINEMYCQ